MTPALCCSDLRCLRNAAWAATLADFGAPIPVKIRFQVLLQSSLRFHRLVRPGYRLCLLNQKFLGEFIDLFIYFNNMVTLLICKHSAYNINTKSLFGAILIDLDLPKMKTHSL